MINDVDDFIFPYGAVDTRGLNLSRKVIEYLNLDLFFRRGQLASVPTIDASFNQIRSINPVVK